MEKKHSLLLLLILGTAFWGVSYPITKLAIGNHSPFVFLFYRFVLATIVLSIVFWKRIRPINAKAIRTGAALALPLMLGIVLQTFGIMYTPASQCAFIAGTCVIMIPILKLLFYRKSAPFQIWLAAIIALAGLFIISVKSGLAISTGDLFTIAGSLGFAIYLIQVEKEAASSDIVPTIVPMFATCAVVCLAMALTASPGNWLPEDQSFWTGIVFCALFSTAYMYTVSNISQRYISAERVAIIYLFEPVFGAIGSFFILGENMGWRLLLGGALILAATIIAEWKVSRYGSVESGS